MVIHRQARTGMRYALACLLMVTLAACGQSTTPDSAVVGVGPSEDMVAASTTSQLVLPTGVLTVGVGSPTAETPQDYLPGRDRLDAPDGYQLVPVWWQLDTLGTNNTYWPIISPSVPKTATISVLDGDRRVSVGNAYRVEGNIVHIPANRVRYITSKSVDPTIEVTYDGFTQSVTPTTGEEDLGVAAPLLDETPKSQSIPCPRARWRSADLDIASCSVDITDRAPYSEGAGWVSPDRTLVMIRIKAELTSQSRDRLAGGDGTVTVEANLDGQASLALPPAVKFVPSAPAGSGDAIFLFDITETGQHRLDLTLGASGSTARRSLTFTLKPNAPLSR